MIHKAHPPTHFPSSKWGKQRPLSGRNELPIWCPALFCAPFLLFEPNSTLPWDVTFLKDMPWNAAPAGWLRLYITCAVSTWHLPLKTCLYRCSSVVLFFLETPYIDVGGFSCSGGRRVIVQQICSNCGVVASVHNGLILVASPTTSLRYLKEPEWSALEEATAGHQHPASWASHFNTYLMPQEKRNYINFHICCYWNAF